MTSPLFPLQEHHLQRAISAQQVFREKKESMVIPVPEAESNVNYYNRLYKGEFKQPKQFIHIQRELKTWGLLWGLCSPSLFHPRNICLEVREWEPSEIHLEMKFQYLLKFWKKGQLLMGVLLLGLFFWLCAAALSVSLILALGLQIFLIQPHLLCFFLPSP